ncbi:MAG: hypothetical protein JSV16_15780 [Candidatus Hydrogenedentota bacterium]|nr:MAG: hypothetical protein JSV16_15780 [Candidatus Hydrogenedentota bacterium]
MRDEEVRPFGERAVTNDVRESKRPQADELHMQKLAVVGQMAARFAHEVKNPLASIRLNIEMLESELKHIADEKIRNEAYELAASVMNEVDRLEAITREYLDYIRISKMRFLRQSLHRMLEELQDFLGEEMETRRIKFVNGFSANLPDIHFDKDRMKEAILNLYKNSADAMPHGGEIKTVTLVSGSRVKIHISDTGSGMQEVDPEQLFQPFFSTKAIGTGLGLPITRDILAAHGGTIAFYRRPEGGATCLLELPIRD